MTAVAGLVPQQGAMCLLDAVVAHDAAGIRCTAVSHRDPTNPLRRAGILPASAGVEYAAQAMAAHGALLAEARPQAGFLAALRGVEFAVERLDDVPGSLEVSATALLRETSGLVYEFVVQGGGRLLLRGQATVMLR